MSEKYLDLGRKIAQRSKIHEPYGNRTRDATRGQQSWANNLKRYEISH